jgi:hypothetical protein
MPYDLAQLDIAKLSFRKVDPEKLKEFNLAIPSPDSDSSVISKPPMEFWIQPRNGNIYTNIVHALELIEDKIDFWPGAMRPALDLFGHFCQMHKGNDVKQFANEIAIPFHSFFEKAVSLALLCLLVETQLPIHWPIEITNSLSDGLSDYDREKMRRSI